MGDDQPLIKKLWSLNTLGLICFHVLLAVGVGIVAAQSIYSVSAIHFIFNKEIYNDVTFTIGGVFYFATIYRGIIALTEDARKRIRQPQTE